MSNEMKKKHFHTHHFIFINFENFISTKRCRNKVLLIASKHSPYRQTLTLHTSLHTNTHLTDILIYVSVQPVMDNNIPGSVVIGECSRVPPVLGKELTSSNLINMSRP